MLATVKSQSMLAETVPPKVLPRVLSRLDLVAIYFALIFGSYGAAQMASFGWAAIPILLIAALVFLVPCALAAYELGTLFPGEGGIYIWAHKTFGPVHGFIAGWLSWVPIFLLIPLDVTVIVAHLQVALGVAWPLWLQVSLQIALIWFVVAIASLKLQTSQAYVRWLSVISFLTAVAIFIAALVYGGAATPVTSDIYSLNIFQHGALFSAAVLWLLGVEVPFNMGAEFSNHKKTAGSMMLWGSLALLLGYAFGIVGILLTTPQSAIDVTTGIANGVAIVSPLLGSLVALAIAFAVSSQSVTYMNAYSRLLFVSGIEKKLPEVFGTVSEKSRAPVPAILVQGLVASIVVLIFSTQAQLSVAFNLYLAALVAVWCVSLFYVYFGVLRARTLYRAEYDSRTADVWRIPGGRLGLWVTVMVGVIFNGVSIYYVFALPWTSGINENSWRWWLAAIAMLVILTGVAIYFRSRRRAAA